MLIHWVEHWHVWSNQAQHRGIPARVAAALGGLLEEAFYGLVLTPAVIYFCSAYLGVESVDSRVLWAMGAVQLLFGGLHSGETLFMYDGSIRNDSGRILPTAWNFGDFIYLNIWKVLFAAGYYATYLALADRHAGASPVTWGAASVATLAASLMHAPLNGLSWRLVAVPSPGILARLRRMAA